MNYLQDQLIAYIGNKRALLPFLEKTLTPYAEKLRQQGTAPVRFYDPFAGAGAVSRLAKSMGFAVHANDWEEYSRVINSAWIGVDRQELDRLFDSFGGVAAAFAELQRSGEAGKPAAPYISRHYAPRRTATADYRRERLFYTRENAEFIDVVRSRIEDWFPGLPEDPFQHKAKNILLGSLLYEAATHANTSGVFKAFHKGFGGHGGDALGRIMAPMQLQIPVLTDSAARARQLITGSDAAAAARGKSCEIAYLDPPYNTHQYGSNYFMLNTIARWDRPAVDDSIGSDGRLQQKAGIRSDWVDTRSPWCSKTGAGEALQLLLDSLDSRYIFMSYNTDGVIPFDQQYEMFSRRGRVRYTATEYHSYRGGRQSMKRRIATTEYILMVDTAARTRLADRERITFHRRLQHLKSLESLRYSPTRLQQAFGGDPAAIDIVSQGRSLFSARLDYGFRVTSWEIDTAAIDIDAIEYIIRRLETAVCRDQQEQFQVAMDILEQQSLSGARRTRMEREALRSLKRFTHRKYQHEYTAAVQRIIALTAMRPELQRLAREVEGIQDIAALRFAG